MTQFLSNERSENLKKELMELGMPENLANEVSTYSDDFDFLDDKLARHTSGSLKWARLMVDAVIEDNAEERQEFAVYIKAEMAIRSAYRQEAMERGIFKNFTRWAKSAEDAIPTLREHTRRIEAYKLNLTDKNQGTNLH